MKKYLPFLASLVVTASALAEVVAYQATAKNTPQTGYLGRVASVQACSTNATGTATISSVTTLSIGGQIQSFTNQLASVTLTDGIGSVSPTNAVYVAPNQSIIVSGSAFPGGSAIIWLER